jgi:NAD(P)-dependent dehydrogenase (short-subunit alcohol dehydrogenase family)
VKDVVLITGASTGFGRAAAELLARRGYRVFATMRDIAGRNAMARAELESLTASEDVAVEVVELDVADDTSVERAAGQILARAGRVDVVINNAGFGNLGVTEAYTIEQFRRLYETNVFGAVRVNRAVLPHMRQRGSGLLIHVSSIAGRSTLPYMSLYCSSKFALESIADAYRFELAPFGIDSVVVEPGAFLTPIFQKPFTAADESRAAEYGAEDYSRRIHEHFQQLLSDPEARPASDVAEAFLRLIETPAGQRPFRTVVGRDLDFLVPYNEGAEMLRQGTAQEFNVTELWPLRKTGRTAAG